MNFRIIDLCVFRHANTSAVLILWTFRWLGLRADHSREIRL